MDISKGDRIVIKENPKEISSGDRLPELDEEKGTVIRVNGDIVFVDCDINSNEKSIFVFKKEQLKAQH